MTKQEENTVRVLCSPGFGAGIGPAWTSVSGDDPQLVALYNCGATCEEVEKAFPQECWGGWEDVAHVDVPLGSWWSIEEYDGAEFVNVVTSLQDAGFRKAQEGTKQ